MHNDGVDAPDHNPCRRHDCHVCCLDTRMTLTEEDVARLEGAGFSGFFRLNTDGDFELRNLDGSCVFLDGGRCRAYVERPEGCRLYPLVLDLAADRVIFDDFCPHRDEFPRDEFRETRLRQSVATENEEARKRRMTGRSVVPGGGEQ